jgi:hypothetical protein
MLAQLCNLNHSKHLNVFLSFENPLASPYLCRMPMTKNRGNAALREPLTIICSGREYSGYYEVNRGMVKVTYDFDTKSTQFRVHPQVTARILLRELVATSLKR